MLAARLPGATELELAFYSPGAEISRGTLKTMIESIGEGGAIRRDGKIVRVPPAYDAKEIPFSIGPRMAMTIPWGDVSTAFHTTGIPNIRVYTAASPKSIARMRRLRPFFPLLGITPIKRAAAGVRQSPHRTGRSAPRQRTNLPLGPRQRRQTRSDDDDDHARGLRIHRHQRAGGGRATARIAETPRQLHPREILRRGIRHDAPGC